MERRKSAVFLDRDGTINVDKGYVHRIEDFAFIPGAPEAIRLLGEAGFLVIVVTNQSGVGRGYYSLEAVHALHRHMDAELKKFGASVDAYYICPHLPQSAHGPDERACNCRKPLPGMLLQAADRFSLCMPSSWMIGDKLTDVEAGLQAGCRSILIATGYGCDESAGLPVGVPYCSDLLAAARLLVAEQAKGMV